MIVVPNPISPTVTELENKRSRVRMRGNARSKKLKELLQRKSSGQHNILDSEARIAMVLADEDFPAASDIDAQITQERLALDATAEAEQSLKAPLAKAKYEAATAVLLGLKKPHDEIMQRIVSPLAQLANAWVELFQLSRDLRDKEVGWRNGVCDLVPGLVEFFGPPNAHSPLATFLQEAVKAGYLKASALPRELRG